MKYSTVIPGTLLLLQASAHYLFGHLLVNETHTEKWKYIRYLNITPVYATEFPPNNQWALAAPIYDLNSVDMRCNHQVDLFAHNTSTATVIAGDEVGFRIVTDYDESLTIYFPGPGQVYLSRANNLETYLGDGDWFKIASAGPSNDTNWQLEGGLDMNFTIPASTPPGKYLMRIEHIWPILPLWELLHMQAQFFISCAHIEVMGPGGGAPTEFVRFPGAYKKEDPGFSVEDHYNNLDQYVAPGPPVWEG
ncbi:lytic polysaccharide monooxygenase [Nemania sp. FL0916]|nr:lytic polysaccharide monooxygenase [Nemania sp. FL0916]